MRQTQRTCLLAVLQTTTPRGQDGLALCLPGRGALHVVRCHVRATQLELRFPGRAARGWRLSRPLDGHYSYMSLLAMRRARCP